MNAILKSLLVLNLMLGSLTLSKELPQHQPPAIEKAASDAAARD